MVEKVGTSKVNENFLCCSDSILNQAIKVIKTRTTQMSGVVSIENARLIFFKSREKNISVSV